MPDNAWQRRADRAEVLATQYPFAREILNFYVQVAQFQRRLQHALESSTELRQLSSGNFPSPPDIPAMMSGFPSFLGVVQRAGPASLRKIAAELQGKGTEAWDELLGSAWSSLNGSSNSASQILAAAFLQPYAELLRGRTALKWVGYTHSLCPFCSRKPVAGVLRQQGDGAARWLLCGFCLAEWEFRRLVCPGCGEEDNRQLPVYSADQFDYVRVECCDTCRTYLKSIDLTKNGRAEPLVDEIASVPLDLWARERDYEKLQMNLLGM